MSTTIKKYCPKCHYRYSRRWYYGYPSKKNQIEYGTPIQKCPSCGEVFIDRDYHEIAIDGIRKVDTKHISGGTLFHSSLSFVFGTFLLIASIYSGSIGYSLVSIGVIALGAYELWDEYRGYDERQEWLQRETQESERRMKNPHYALQLKALGYDVPDCYLRRVSDE